MFKLALRNIFRQKMRSSMTLGAITFGVLSLILSGGFVRDVTFQLGEALIHSQSGHLQISKKGYFSYGSRSPEKFTIDNPNELQQQITKISGVNATMSRISFSGLLNNGRTDWPIIGEGVEPDKEAKLGSFLQIVSGRKLTEKDQFGLVVGYGVARALNIAPGDRVSLLLNTAGGALNNVDLEVVGVFQSFSKDFDARAVRLPIAAAHDLLRSTRINSVVVLLAQTADTQRVAGQISKNVLNDEFELKTWQQLNDFYEKTVALYDAQFGFLQFVILIMVVLSVSNSINMTVFERIGEFGTMMSLGNRRTTVTQLIVAESALLGLIGSSAGVIIGAALASIISVIGIPMPPPPGANLGYTAHIQLIPLVILASFTIGFFATVLAALIPAFRITRIPIVDALRQMV